MFDWLVVFIVVVLLFGPILYNLLNPSAESEDERPDTQARTEPSRNELLGRANRRRPAA